MSNLLHRAALVAAAALCAVPTLLADVLTVGPAGAFPDPQSAVDAATDGDVVLLEAGGYLGFSIDDVSLTVAPEPGAAVAVTGVDVRGLAASRTVVLSGLIIRSTLVADPALAIEACAGSVRVESCDLRGVGAPGAAGSRGALVSGCADVAFAGCTIRGGGQDKPLFPPNLPGQPALTVVASVVSVHGGSLTGGDGLDGSFSGPGTENGSAGGAGLEVQDADVFAEGVVVTGGRGGDGLTCGGAGDGGDGGAAVVVQGSPATTRFRRRDGSVTGGTGGKGTAGGPCGGGFGNDGSDGADVVDPGGLAVTLPGSARLLSAPAPVREREPFTFTVTGEPGELVAVLASVSPATAWTPGAGGRLLLATPFVAHVAGVVPSGGTLVAGASFPELGPGVASALLFTQVLVVEPGGAPVLGSPHTAVVLDGAS